MPIKGLVGLRCSSRWLNNSSVLFGCRTKWKRQTAVGLELLAEAGNYSALQRMFPSPYFYHPSLLGTVDSTTAAAAAAAMYSSMYRTPYRAPPRPPEALWSPGSSSTASGPGGSRLWTPWANPMAGPATCSDKKLQKTNPEQQQQQLKQQRRRQQPFEDSRCA